MLRRGRTGLGHGVSHSVTRSVSHSVTTAVTSRKVRNPPYPYPYPSPVILLWVYHPFGVQGPARPLATGTPDDQPVDAPHLYRHPACRVTDNLGHRPLLRRVARLAAHGSHAGRHHRSPRRHRMGQLER